jgi:hypothetical protein
MARRKQYVEWFTPNNRRPVGDGLWVTAWVPTADDNVDLDQARMVFLGDRLAIDEIIKRGGVPMETLIALDHVEHDWNRFWSKRHPDRVMRKFFAEVVAVHYVEKFRPS